MMMHVMFACSVFLVGHCCRLLQIDKSERSGSEGKAHGHMANRKAPDQVPLVH